MNDIVTTQKLRSNSTYFMMYCSRFGKILSNISIVCLLLCVASIITTLISVFLIMFGIIMMICTLGLVFAIFPNYWSMLTSTGEFVGKFASFMVYAWKFLAPIGIICAILSVVFLLLDRNNKHTARIVFSVLVLISIIIIIFVLLRGN